MNGLHELSNIYDLQLLSSTDAVECHFDVEFSIWGDVIYILY